MQRSVGAILAQLAAEGLAPAGSEERAREALAPELTDDLPWYMRAAVAVGAWVATTFVLFSLFAVAGIRDEGPAMAVGALLVGTGIFMRRKATTEFLRWAAVALSLAGLAMLTVGAKGVSDSTSFAAAVCLLVSLALIGLSPDATLRFLCTLSGTVALLAWLAGENGALAFDAGIVLLAPAVAYVWRSRLLQRSDRQWEMLAPVGYALVVAFFGLLLARTLATSTHASWSIDVSRDAGALGPLPAIICTAALMTLVWKVLDEHGASLSTPASFGALGGAVALGAVTLDSPGIVAGVAMLMLAFDRRNRVLLGMAAIFLIVFGSFYYYSLHLTLLAKSGVLVGSGLILFGVRDKVVNA